MTITNLMSIDKIFLYLSIILLSTCGEEQFSAIRNQGSETARARESFSLHRCSKFSLIKPAVDVLFLWDNSSSQFYLSQESKKALNNMVSKVSNDFDFRILMAPMMGSGSKYYFTNGTISPAPAGISAVSSELAADTLNNFSTVSGSTEAGVQQSINLIKGHKDFFRNNAYLIIVLMSNEDDDSWQTGSSTYDQFTGNSKEKQKYIDARVSDLKSIKNGLSTGYLRFITLTVSKASVYREVSQQIHAAGGLTADQSSPTADNYNIENGNFQHAFNSINNTIQKTLLKHKYDYWPVLGQGSPEIAINEIKVFKNETIPVPVSSTDGFTYVGDQTNQNTRYEPTPGEPFTGKLIQLHGSARITYPDCLTVKTTTPKEFFGYIPLAAKPVKTSIKLIIDGTTINESKSNGWELLIDEDGVPLYYKNKNIQITSPNDDSPKSPGLSKSGYMLKLHGSAIYTNSSVIKFNYLPRGSKSSSP